MTTARIAATIAALMSFEIIRVPFYALFSG
jgi:hypothetical protein